MIGAQPCINPTLRTYGDRTTPDWAKLAAKRTYLPHFDMD